MSSNQVAANQMVERLSHLESKVDAIVDVTHDLCKIQERMNEQHRLTYYLLLCMEASFKHLRNEMLIGMESLRIAADISAQNMHEIRAEVSAEFERQNDIAGQKFLDKQRCEAEATNAPSP